MVAHVLRHSEELQYMIIDGMIEKKRTAAVRSRKYYTRHKLKKDASVKTALEHMKKRRAID